MPWLKTRIAIRSAMKANDPTFDRRYLRHEIDLHGRPIPRNPEIVARLKEEILATREPALEALTTTRTTNSYLCGAPRLPEDLKWPTYRGRPLSCIAQIDLEDVPKSENFGYLPETGVLFFFAGCYQDDFSGKLENCDGGEWHSEAARVLFTPKAGTQELNSPDGAPPLRERQNIEFNVIQTFASMNGYDACQYEDNAELWQWYSELTNHRHAPAAWQIGGWPKALQQQRMIDHTSPEKWKMIGQFDVANVSTNYDGYSRGFYWINTQDAKNLDFEKAILCGQSD